MYSDRNADDSLDTSGTCYGHLAPNADAVAIQVLKLEHEGCERDRELSEPTEPAP